MTKFIYNYTKNANTGFTPFELNYIFHFKVLFKDKINPWLKSYFVNKLANILEELIKIYY